MSELGEPELFEKRRQMHADLVRPGGLCLDRVGVEALDAAEYRVDQARVSVRRDCGAAIVDSRRRTTSR